VARGPAPTSSSPTARPRRARGDRTSNRTSFIFASSAAREHRTPRGARHWTSYRSREDGEDELGHIGVSLPIAYKTTGYSELPNHTYNDQWWHTSGGWYTVGQGGSIGVNFEVQWNIDGVHLVGFRITPWILPVRYRQWEHPPFCGDDRVRNA